MEHGRASVFLRVIWFIAVSSPTAGKQFKMHALLFGEAGFIEGFLKYAFDFVVKRPGSTSNI